MDSEKQQSIQDLLQENEVLRDKLGLAEDTLSAIKSGAIDAIVINGANGPQVYTLQGADHTYKTIVERMSEGAVIINKEGLILYSNDRFSKLINKPLSQTIGSLFSACLTPEYQNQFYEMLERAWTQPVKGEFILHPSNGDILPVYISFNTIGSTEGEVMGMTVTDLSDQKERKNLESLFAQAPAIVNLYKGPDHILELVHPVTVGLLADKNCKGMKAREAMSSIEDPAFFELLDKVYQLAEPCQQIEIQVQIKNPDGTTKHSFFNISYQPWFDIYKKVQGVMTYAIDVTEQVNARRKVEQSAKQFEILLESIQPITWSNLPSGKVTFYNQRWYEYTSRTFKQTKDIGWKSVIHPDDLKTTMAVYREAFVKGSVFELENRLKRGSDGAYRWHQFRAMPIRDDSGKIILWVGTATDIHDQKTFSEKIKAINRELSNKNEELERINNDLDNFVYTASHDLKAPVSNIEGLISALSDTLQISNTGNEATAIIQMINLSILQFKETIVDLTEITKIQKNEVEDKNEIIQCLEIIEDVMFSIKSMIDQTKALIKLDLQECKEFRFSKKNFKSIIYNLLSNAIKYRSFERKPEVLIQMYKDGNKFHLIVKDNGLGMNLKNKETKIFSMFRRLHDHVEGSGIGLYLVKRIMDNTGGTIKVESEVGKGTTFTLCFNMQE